MTLFSKRFATNQCRTTVAHASVHARMRERTHARRASTQLNPTADLTPTPANSDSPFRAAVCRQQRVRATGSGKRRLCSVKEPRRLAAASRAVVTEQTRAGAKESSTGWKSTKGKQREGIVAAVFRCYEGLRGRKVVQVMS